MLTLNKITIGEYIMNRLHELGINEIFAVPGDYSLTFLKQIEDSNLIKIINTCNELNAGYAADGYARIKGISAAVVTYGVGGLSIMNAVAGQYAERVPVIIISGSPKVEKGILKHHTTGDLNAQLNMFNQITVASIRISDTPEVTSKIDSTIITAYLEKRPVYLELPEDMVLKNCDLPRDSLWDIINQQNRDSKLLLQAEKLALEITDALKKASFPLIVGGPEIQRIGGEHNFETIIKNTGVPFMTLMPSKGIISEQHPQFIGNYLGPLSTDKLKAYVEHADLIVALGTWRTDTSISGLTPTILNSERVIEVTMEENGVKLFQLFLEKLALTSKKLYSLSNFKNMSATYHEDFLPSSSHENNAHNIDLPLKSKDFFQRIQSFLREGDIVIAETGDALAQAASLVLKNGSKFLSQAFYLSIGYALPATLGALVAADSERENPSSTPSRVILFIGDGSFQMTAQELSSIIRYQKAGQCIIFLINNDGYLIERLILDGNFNDIVNWKYSLLPHVFGGSKESIDKIYSTVVSSNNELEMALELIDNQREHKDHQEERNQTFFFIEVQFTRYDCSEALKKFGLSLTKNNANRISLNNDD